MVGIVRLLNPKSNNSEISDSFHSQSFRISLRSFPVLEGKMSSCRK